MSILTKVFIILVFIISVVTTAVVATLYGHRIDFPNKWQMSENLRYQEKKPLLAQIVQWKIATENMEAKYRIETDKVKRLEEALKGKDNVILEKERQINKFQEDLVTQKEIIDRLQVAQEKLTNQLNEMQARLDDAKKRTEQALAQMRDATQQLLVAKQQADSFAGQLNQLEIEFQKIVKDNRDLQDKMIAYQKKFGDLGLARAPGFNLRGLVQDVDLSLKALVLNLGADDGLRPGDQFIVRRGETYIATVVVTDKIEKDRALARIEQMAYDPQRNDDIFPK